MYSLKKSEEAICRLADTDPAAAEALGLLSVRYSDAELAHTLLIGAIYIERRNDQVWQLAMRGHISESTAYRYRKRYIATFYHFYRSRMAIKLEMRPIATGRAGRLPSTPAKYTADK